jgi:AraC-like DNA-binding protein
MHAMGKIMSGRGRAHEEHAAYRVLPVRGGLGALTATYQNHTFAPHCHDTFVVGVFDRGASTIRCQGECETLGVNDILVINPGTIHSAGPATAEGWQYRAIYPSEALVASVLPGRARHQLQFARIAIRAPALARAVRCDLERLSAANAALDGIVASIITAVWRYAGRHTFAVRNDGSAEALERVRSLMDERPCASTCLKKLAKEAGMSRYHFIRAFTKRFGVTPYAYFLERRVRRARELFESGAKPAAVAAECGFADQSHLNRHFKRVVGVTPAKYAAAVAG